MSAVRRLLRAPLAPLVITVALALTPAGIATVRMKVKSGETVEILAERYYGDAKKGAVLRAANRLADGAEPEPGAFFKIPSAVVHTVQTGETLEDIADRYLGGEGALELLAEANGLAPTASLTPGQVITVFAEVEVDAKGRSAEDLAALFLDDASLGARLRRYNGLADGAALEGRVAIPLVGLEARKPTPDESAPKVALSETAKDETAKTETPTTEATTTEATTTETAQDETGKGRPDADEPTEDVVTAPAALDLSVPVTGKRATLEGFSHALHTGLKIAGQPVGCLSCHPRERDDSVEHRAPRASDCLICHRQSDALPESLRTGVVRRLDRYTNHFAHMSAERRKESELLKDISCRSCHAADPDAVSGMGTLGHTACAPCHQAGKAAPILVGDRKAEGCTGCHGSTESEDPRSQASRYLRAHLVPARGRVGDTRFDHGTHLVYGKKDDERAPEIACTTCHADVSEARTSDEISHVKMQGCTECHRQATWVGLQPPTSCGGCHLHLRQGAPPMGDLVMRKPLDHTPFFRRHHDRAAKEQPAMCASCHAGADPTDGNRCDTCHRTTRPRDHTAGFRDRVHGRLAQIDSERCMSCHRTERCESCHRVIPQSHLPLGGFVDQGLHASRARLDLGACLTCHRFETTCTRCHSAAVR